MNRRGFLASLCAWLWALVFGKVPEFVAGDGPVTEAFAGFTEPTAPARVGKVIYWDVAGSTACDTNDGLSPATAVRTLGAARARMFKGDQLHATYLYRAGDRVMMAPGRYSPPRFRWFTPRLDPPADPIRLPRVGEGVWR